MNAERLLIVLEQVKKEVEEQGIVNLLEQLSRALSSQAGQPQQPQFQQQVSNALQSLYQQLDKAPSNNFSPLWRQMLEEMDLAGKLGTKLKSTLERIFERNRITVVVAKDEVAALSSEIASVKAAIDGVISGFAKLHIGAEDLSPGECEIGILVPRAYVNNDLFKFGEELTELDSILETFSELATGSRSGFAIRSISSSDLTVFLDAAPKVCALIAISIERVVTLYKQLLEIRRLHAEMKKQEVPAENLKGIEEYANNHMTEKLELVVEQLLSENYNQKDAGRKNELRTALRFALKKIANRVDRGFNVEIRIQPIKITDDSEADIAELKQQQEEIEAAAKNLQFLRVDGEPILFLETEQRKPAKDKKPDKAP